ncbi:MAG: hypothetical protein SPE59_05130 [Treponema sp.]|nr:hypothetical protein [Treponema sp.]
MTRWLIGSFGSGDNITDNTKYIEYVDSVYRDGCDFVNCDTVDEAANHRICSLFLMAFFN